MGLADTQKLMAELGLIDKMTPGLRKAGGSLDRFDTRLGRVASGAGKMSAGFARAGTIIAGAAVTGLGAAAKAAIDWEDAFTGVSKTVDASDADLAALNANLREMSTTMPTTAIDLAHIAEAAGAMGVGFDEATGKTNTATIAAFTKQVAILAETTDVGAEDAATALGQLTNVLGLGADEYDNFAAALVDLGNKGASTESQILEITKRAGGAAAGLDIAADATLGWASAAANLGLNQELAGTSLQKFFQQSQRLVSSKGGLEAMADIAGVSAKKFKKAFDKDASGALEDFLVGLAKLPKDERLKAVDDLFGKGSGLSRLVTGFADSMDQNLTPALNTAETAWDDATAAQIEFEKRNATVKSSIQRLRNGLIDAAVTVGEGFAPAVGNAATKLAEFLRLPENQQALKTLGQDIGKAIEGIDWKAVLDGTREFVDVLKVAFDWAKRIFDMLNALPTEVKGAAGGFLALNKLSGGMIGGGLGDILGALGKGALGQVPGVNRLVAQPVLVTNWPLGFGAGGAGGLPGGVAGAAGGIGAGTIAAAAGIAALAAAAVVIEQQEISGNSTAQADAIRTGLDSSVAGKSLPELKTALAGVEQGITDLSSNPLYALVQGDALDDLHAMRATLKAAISTQAPGNTDPSGNRQSVGDIIATNLAVDAANRTTTAVEGAKGSISTAIDLKGDATKQSVDTAKVAIDGAKRATEIGSSTVASAIRNKDLSVQLDNKTVVHVNVSATGVKTTTTYQNRVGKSTGSHGGSGTGHAPGHGPLP